MKSDKKDENKTNGQGNNRELKRIYRWCYHGDNDNNNNNIIEIPNDLIIMIIMCSNSDNDYNNYNSEGINK